MKCFGESSTAQFVFVTKVHKGFARPLVFSVSLSLSVRKKHSCKPYNPSFDSEEDSILGVGGGSLNNYRRGPNNYQYYWGGAPFIIVTVIIITV